MIYAEHNFTDNYLNAVGYNDEFMITNIILDELAKLIVDDKKIVVEMLRKNNINVSINDNNEKISNLLSKEIYNNNTKILNEVSNIISSKQFNDIKVKNFANAIGESKTKTPSKFKANLNTFLADDRTQQGMSTLISIGLKKAYNKSNKEKTLQSNAVLNERLKMNEMNLKSNKPKSNNNKKKIIIGISIAVTLVIATIVVIKLVRKKSNSVVSSTPTI